MSSVATIVAGGQHPWKGDILRWRAILEALALAQFGDTKIYALFHNSDAAWLQVDGVASVKWEDGNKFPRYFPTGMPLLSSLDPEVRKRLNAPRPCCWLKGPPTDLTIAWFDKYKRDMFLGLLDERIERANDWYRRLAELAGYNFRRIPKPSESESVFDWIKLLANKMGISGANITITTTLDLFREYQGPIQEIAFSQWGEWWEVDLKTLTRRPWDGGPLPEGAILVAKAETLVYALKRLLNLHLYATHLPYIKEVYDVDGQPLYRHASVRIKREDQERLEKVLGKGLFPRDPDTLSALALGYGLEGKVQMLNGDGLVEVEWRRPV